MPWHVPMDSNMVLSNKSRWRESRHRLLCWLVVLPDGLFGGGSLLNVPGLLLAALKGLLMMVSVNLPLVDNEQYVQAMQQEYSRLLVTGTELEARVNAAVDARAAQVL